MATVDYSRSDLETGNIESADDADFRTDVDYVYHLIQSNPRHEQVLMNNEEETECIIQIWMPSAKIDYIVDLIDGHIDDLDAAAREAESLLAESRRSRPIYEYMIGIYADLAREIGALIGLCSSVREIERALHWYDPLYQKRMEMVITLLRMTAALRTLHQTNHDTMPEDAVH